MTPSLLVVDDETYIRQYLSKLLKQFCVYAADTAESALQLLKSQPQIDVVISDINMPGMSGLDLLKRIKQRPEAPEVILVTGSGNIESAVDAMRAGALDYLSKPLEPKTVLATTEKAIEIAALRRKSRNLRDKLLSARGLYFFDGQSDVSRKCRQFLEKAARRDDLPVIIQGETGTGKELAAEAIHNHSERARGPFNTINCSSLQNDRTIEILFGSPEEREPIDGVSPNSVFGKAQGGTLLLSQIECLPLDAQSHLSKILGTRGTKNEHIVDCRVVATTEEDLFALCQNGQFLNDLFFSLNVLSTTLAPLRERKSDIQQLSRRYLESAGMRSKAQSLSPNALSALESHSWPGNLRELRHCIEAAAALSDGAIIQDSDIPLVNTYAQLSEAIRDDSDWIKMTYYQAVEYSKSAGVQNYLNALLRETKGNVSAAARIANIERPSMHRLLRKHRITIDRERLNPK